MLGVGVIGYGYWGPNLVSKFFESRDATVVAVSDLNTDRLALAARRYPSVATMSDPCELISDSRVDAVVIATPVVTHYPLARRAIQSGKHVLVSKPMVSSVDEARDLVAEAAARHVTLMVDHTFVYTPAVRKIRQLTLDGTLGDIYYYDSVRVNLGLFKHDVNVVWDLAVHDLSILDYILPTPPVAISAVGARHFRGEPENIAYLTLQYPNNVIAHVHVNWLAPVKVRLTLVGGSRRMIVYDDLQAVEKVKIYESGVTFSDSAEKVYEMLVSYRTGDMWSPRLDGAEALQLEVQEFLHCVETGTEPLTGGRSGLRVITALDAASTSILGGGRPVLLPAETW